MTEIYIFRINRKYSDMLFHPEEGRHAGSSVKIVELAKSDVRLKQIPLISSKIKTQYGDAFYFGWEIKRKYSKKELTESAFLHFKIASIFEPSGEESGTGYDESMACRICGANRKQITPLVLKKGSIPKKDIAKTISGEVVVSEKFVTAVLQRGLKGLNFKPVLFSKEPTSYYQLIPSKEVKLSESTKAGVDPFDFSEASEGTSFTLAGGYSVNIGTEVYRCPLGHTIGLNLLSEIFITEESLVDSYDLYVSDKKVGVKRGLLRPEPIYVCSQALKKLVEDEMLKGLEFEVARIE